MTPTVLQSRKEEIVSVAVRLIANRGIQSLTIKNIAGEIGITEPAIYKHFKGKAEIIASVLDEFDKFSILMLKSGVNLNEPLESIQQYWMKKLDSFSAYPELAKIMFSEALFINDPAMQARLLSTMHQLKLEMDKILSYGQQKGFIRSDIHTKELFRIIFGAMRLLVTQWGLTGFMFDLKSEGTLLWGSLEKMIQK